MVPHPKVPYSPEYLGVMEQAHVLPAYPDRWYYPASRNPEGSFAHLNAESAEFVRFINPGDLRVADELQRPRLRRIRILGTRGRCRG